MKKLIKKILGFARYEKSNREASSLSERRLVDISTEDRQVLLKVERFTMTSHERLISLIDAVKYICRNDIPGDIVECGVWRGGSMMAAALSLLNEGNVDRNLFLYDTFSGMSEPSDEDARYDGLLAASQLDSTLRNTGVWCYSPIDEVNRNVLSTGYPGEKIHLIEGKVEETVPARVPENISLLRLDTDWYESTRHELKHLFPLLSQGGVMIIDDYGHWQGARKAVDEFLENEGRGHFLHRIDYTGRLLIKK
jgi:O-methyltransferase